MYANTLNVNGSHVVVAVKPVMGVRSVIAVCPLALSDATNTCNRFWLFGRIDSLVLVWSFLRLLRLHCLTVVLAAALSTHHTLTQTSPVAPSMTIDSPSLMTAPSLDLKLVAWILISAPTTQDLPQPLATTAA